jgi:hypothetical protein
MVRFATQEKYEQDQKTFNRLRGKKSTLTAVLPVTFGRSGSIISTGRRSGEKNERDESALQGLACRHGHGGATAAENAATASEVTRSSKHPTPVARLPRCFPPFRFNVGILATYELISCDLLDVRRPMGHANFVHLLGWMRRNSDIRLLLHS